MLKTQPCRDIFKVTYSTGWQNKNKKVTGQKRYTLQQMNSVTPKCADLNS